VYTSFSATFCNGTRLLTNLEVGSNHLLAFLAAVGEQLFVTLDAEGLLVAEDVPEAGQIEGAVEAGERPTAADIHCQRCAVHDFFTIRFSAMHDG